MTPIKRTLEVTYDSNGGSAIVGSPVTYSITDVGTTLPVPTKAGYTFTGWKFWDNYDGITKEFQPFCEVQGTIGQ